MSHNSNVQHSRGRDPEMDAPSRFVLRMGVSSFGVDRMMVRGDKTACSTPVVTPLGVSGVSR